MVTKNSRIVQASVISTLLLVSAISITQSSTAQNESKFSADLMPRSGSNASGTATLELQDNAFQYNIDATGLNNVTDIAISQETGTGRAPDVVIIRTASQSGLGQGSGSLSGNFTESELIGPLEGKTLADFVNAINDEKIIIRVQTVPFPLGEIAGNVTAGAGNATAGAGNATAVGRNVTVAQGYVARQCYCWRRQCYCWLIHIFFVSQLLSISV